MTKKKHTNKTVIILSIVTGMYFLTQLFLMSYMTFQILPNADSVQILLTAVTFFIPIGGLFLTYKLYHKKFWAYILLLIFFSVELLFAIVTTIMLEVFTNHVLVVLLLFLFLLRGFKELTQ